MANMLPLLLMSGGRLFGRGMIRKVLMFSTLGMAGLLLGGGFSLKDFLLIPMIAPMISGMFGLGGNSNGGAAAGLSLS